MHQVCGCAYYSYGIHGGTSRTLRLRARQCTGRLCVYGKLEKLRVGVGRLLCVSAHSIEHVCMRIYIVTARNVDMHLESQDFALATSVSDSQARLQPACCMYVCRGIPRS